MNRIAKLAVAGAMAVGLGATADAHPQTDPMPEVAAADVVMDGAMATAAAEHPAARGHDGTYDIRMTRGLKVGQVMHVHAEGSQQQTMRSVVDGIEQPAQTSRAVVVFDAKARVLAVDRHGRATRVAYTVNTGTVTRDDEVLTSMPAGSTVLAECMPDHTRFEQDGQPVAEEIAAAFQMVAGLDGTGPTDDEVFGTDRPRGVGESWAIDRKQAITKMMLRSAEGTGEIGGASTLVDVTEHKGHPCMLVHSQVFAEDMIPDLGTLPAGMNVVGGQMTMTWQRLLPRDTRLPSLTDSGLMNMEAVLRSAQGGGTELRLSVVQSVDVATTPLDRFAGAESNSPVEPASEVASEEAATGTAVTVVDEDDQD